MFKEWKDIYIRVWVIIVGVWVGLVKLMRIYVLGINFGFLDVVFELLNFRLVLRIYESFVFLMFSKDFWFVEEVSVELV